MLRLKDLYLLATLRFRSGEERQLRFPIYTKYGTEVVSILGPELAESGGLITYKADLFSGSRTLLTWRHQLWNDTISVPIEE